MARNIAPATVFDADAANASAVERVYVFEDTDNFVAFTAADGDVELFEDTDNFAALTLDAGADEVLPFLFANFVAIAE